MKIQPGKIYRVSEGSGLASNRRGIAVRYTGQSEETIRKFDTGRYRRFDPKREAILFDPIKRELFVMFKGRLFLDESQDYYPEAK